MKQKLPWILAIAMLLCAVVVLLWPTNLGVRPRTELSFLCFSNAAAGPEAVFAIHLPKNHGGSHVRRIELDRWDNGSWSLLNSNGAPSLGARFTSGGVMGMVAVNGKPIDGTAYYRLLNLNDSWRIRTHVVQQPPLSFFKGLRLRMAKHPPVNQFGGDPRPGFDYWITNVVGPEAARQ